MTFIPKCLFGGKECTVLVLSTQLETMFHICIKVTGRAKWCDHYDVTSIIWVAAKRPDILTEKGIHNII